MKISIVVPMLNEAQTLPDLLEHLLKLRRGGCEVVIVDGGSSDASVALASAAGFPVIAAPAGRARQMNIGAVAARGDVLLFLHADTRLPGNAVSEIFQALGGSMHVWGRFDVAISGRAHMLAVIAAMMNVRSRMTGIATGDQAIFVHRSTFNACGGFPDQPLMEDIELSRRLRRLSPPACIRDRATTSGRRWEQRGVWKTILLMWRLRLAYWLGATPEALARQYR